MNDNSNQFAMLQIEQQKSQLAQMTLRLNTVMNQQLKNKQQNLLRASQNLTHLNPQAVLTRGYAFIQNKLGTIISSSQQLRQGDDVMLTFGAGSAEATIDKTNPWYLILQLSSKFQTIITE